MHRMWYLISYLIDASHNWEKERTGYEDLSSTVDIQMSHGSRSVIAVNMPLQRRLRIYQSHLCSQIFRWKCILQGDKFPKCSKELNTEIAVVKSIWFNSYEHFKSVCWMCTNSSPSSGVGWETLSLYPFHVKIWTTNLIN